MALLNYTTTIAVDKTLGEIQWLLARHGARSIMTTYDGQGNPTAIAFLVPTAFGDRGFRLPANIDAVWKVMTRQYERGQIQRRFCTKEQAARVGWRILKDWLEAQMALIETEMVSLDQVMLPYLVVDSSDRTLYEVMRGRQLALPAAKAEQR
jgi:hypothetical protein